MPPGMSVVCVGAPSACLHAFNCASAEGWGNFGGGLCVAPESYRGVCRRVASCARGNQRDRGRARCSYPQPSHGFQLVHKCEQGGMVCDVQRTLARASFGV